jgi:hypothetical protein
MTQVRCDRCGKLLEADDNRRKARCPHCGAKVTVPDLLAALPRPILPPGASGGAGSRGLGGGDPAPTVAAALGALAPADSPEEPEETEPGESLLMRLEVYVMPWLISAALHVGLLLILLFAVAIVARPPAPAPVLPTASDWSPAPPGDMLKLAPDGPENSGPKLSDARPGPLPPGEHKGFAPVSKDQQGAKGWGAGEQKGDMEAYGFASGAGGGGSTGDFGMARGGGTEARFYGSGGGGGKAYNVIYVLDHSGSTAPYFDDIRQELKNSIFKLTDKQNFHVIFFARDLATEKPPRRLARATEDNKRQAAKFVNEVVAGGHGSSPIPAMIAALNAFRNATDKRGQLLYILTDGQFEASGYQYKTTGGAKLTGSEAVVAWLRENNKDTFMHVYLIVLGDKPEPRTEQVMNLIAKENGGEAKFVKPE